MVSDMSLVVHLTLQWQVPVPLVSADWTKEVTRPNSHRLHREGLWVQFCYSEILI